MVNGITNLFFLLVGLVAEALRVVQHKFVPFSFLHRVHGRFHEIMVAVDLLLEVFLTFSQLPEGLIHTFHFLLALKTFSMLAAHVPSDCIENSLESILATNFALFLKLEKV